MVMWIDYEDTPVRYSDRLERIPSAMSDYQTTDDNSEVLRNGESRTFAVDIAISSGDDGQMARSIERMSPRLIVIDAKNPPTSLPDGPFEYVFRHGYQPEGSASVTGAPHAIWGTVRPR